MSTEGIAVPSMAPRRSWMYRSMPRGVLGFTMLFTGIASLIHEYVFSTVFSYLLGNSIEQFSVTIGVMFAAMGVGTWLQKHIQKALAEVFLAIELTLVVVGSFAPIALQWSYAELPDDFGWIKFAYMALPGLIIGMEIPLVMRINERFAKNLGSNIAQTWAWDYIGGAIGVVAWIWMLRHFVPLTHISFWIGGCNLLVAIISLVFFWRRGMLHRRSSAWLISATSLAVVMALIIGYARVDSWGRMVGQRLYDDPIETSITTKYQNIVLTKGAHPTNPGDHNWQLWLNGNKQFSSVDEAIYHEYLVHPAMNLAAHHQRVLILGGGDGLALREVLKYPDVKEVTLVDLDPEMIKFAREHPVMARLNQGALSDGRVTSNLSKHSLGSGVVDSGSKRDVTIDTGEVKSVECSEEHGTSQCLREPITEKVANVNVFTIDADRFITDRPGWWDVVIVDLPDPSSVELAKLYSTEFYGKVKNVLSPGGLVVVQSTSPYHAKETFLCILRSMTAAGLNSVPYHDNVPSFGDWGWILGSPTLPPGQLHQRANNLDGFGVETQQIEANSLKRALIFNRGWLSSQSSEISTLMRPVVFEYYVHEGWKVE
jgi:spermidine synthase